jgi:hypothetical protein
MILEIYGRIPGSWSYGFGAEGSHSPIGVEIVIAEIRGINRMTSTDMKSDTESIGQKHSLLMDHGAIEHVDGTTVVDCTMGHQGESRTNTDSSPMNQRSPRYSCRQRLFWGEGGK